MANGHHGAPRPLTVKSGTWYRLVREIPELDRLLGFALELSALLVRFGVRRCRYRLWAFLFEGMVSELVGYHSGRNSDAWKLPDVPDSLGGRLDAAEYDIVRETLLGELPPCPADCDCQARHERLSTPRAAHFPAGARTSRSSTP